MKINSNFTNIIGEIPMKNMFTKRALFSMLIAFMGLMAAEMSAQDFTNIGTGTYNAVCGAVIKMKSDTGTISGNLIGTNAANVIPGVVDWASTRVGQNVKPYFYTLLVLSGGTKNVASGVNVLGGICADLLTGYNTPGGLDTYPYIVTGGAATYAGQFSYSGITDQNIFPDTYDSLNIAGAGNATVRTGTTVTAVTMTSSSDAPVLIAGNLSLTTGNSNLQGLVTVDTTGTFAVGLGDVNIGGDLALNGTLDIDNGAGGLGTVTLGGTTTIGTSGILQLGQTGDLVINGAVSNVGDGNNLAMDCLSSITYSGIGGTQIILPTLNTAGHTYGNLFLKSGNKQSGTASYGNNVSICTNFSLDTFKLNMYANNGTLIMNNPAGTAVYTALAEVEGKMKRVTDATSKSYTFNNAATSVSLAANVNNPDSIIFNIRPGVAPNDYNVAKDVNRKINLTYVDNAGHFAMTAQAGYLIGEGPGAWAAPYTQNSIRMYEAATAPAREKIGTGNNPVRTAATATGFGSISLAGITDTSNSTLTNGIGYFASGNDILLSAGPTTFYSIADGRWTNPNTWDEASVPDSIDNAEIRHSVYVGIDGSFIGTAGGADDTPTNNTKSEYSHYGNTNNPAVNNILIVQKTAGTGTPNPALIVGNEDNPDNYVFRTSVNGTVTNNNTTANNLAFPLVAATTAKNTVVSGDIQGVWLVPYLTGTKIPGLGAFDFQNAGNFNNQGLIEVGK